MTSLVARVWREEAWGYPARPPHVVASFKFPTQPKHTHSFLLAYRLTLALYLSAWMLVVLLGKQGAADLWLGEA